MSVMDHLLAMMPGRGTQMWEQITKFSQYYVQLVIKNKLLKLHEVNSDGLQIY